MVKKPQLSSSLHIAEPALKDILEKLGFKPIVLRNWKITIEEDHAQWCYNIRLTWRTYQIRKILSKDNLYLSQTGAVQYAVKVIANELWKFNEAEDEEHMEALVLLSMRPTNGPHSKQL